MPEDTIAAIATPMGEGGLAVIRISGPQALEMADGFFVPAGKTAMKPSTAPTHTLHYGHVLRDGHRFDKVLLAVLRAPRTFTREDTVEISCHGGQLPAKAVLDAVLAGGARLAQPGEFTSRAFLNGRIDLAQAEAVADVIHARTELALAAAKEQLAGKLSTRINQLRDELMQTLAHIEAHIDFPDEDIAPDTRAQLLRAWIEALAFMDELLRPPTKGKCSAAACVPPSWAAPTRANRACSTNCWATTAPSSRPCPAPLAIRSRKPPIFAVCRWCSSTPPACGNPAISSKREGIRRSHEILARAELVLHVLDASACSRIRIASTSRN